MTKPLLLLALLLLCSCSVAFADDFKTSTGKEYKNAKVFRVEADGIVITFSSGVVKIPFAELSPETQKKYGYDPQAAAATTAQTAVPTQSHVPEGSLVNSEAIDYVADGFTINIPSGWQVIPQSEVAKRVQSIRKAARAANIPDAKIPDFRYGYQLSSDRWFSCPYVLVAINRAGRMPEDELRKLPTVDLAGIINDVRSALRGKVSNFQVGRVVYDPATQIIWIASEVEYPDIGKVDNLCGELMTENGAIMVYGYALPNSFDQYKPTFIQIAESIHPSEALRYKPHN